MDNPYFLNLNASFNDQQFITSRNLTIRTFEIKYNPVFNTSTFILTQMDKNRPFNVATSQLSSYGNWTTLLNNSVDLSCVLLYENET